MSNLEFSRAHIESDTGLVVNIELDIEFDTSLQLGFDDEGDYQVSREVVLTDVVKD